MFQKIINNYEKSFTNVEEDLRKRLSELRSPDSPSATTDIKIQQLIRKIQKETAEQYKILTRVTRANVVLEAANDTANELLNGRAQGILNEQISIALMKNKEFNTPIYSSRLFGTVMNSPSLIQILINPKNIIASEVVINASSVFGNPEEWARAVEKVREEVKRESVERKRASKTLQNSYLPEAFVDAVPGEYWESYFFYEKFYRPAMEGGEIWTSGGKGQVRNPKRRVDKEKANKEAYFNTIGRRLAACRKPAPFWELLDKGTAAYPKGSGVAFIQHRSTNFIHLAKSEIKREFIQNFSDIKNVYESEKSDFIHKVNTYIKELKAGEDYLFSLLKVRAEKPVTEVHRLEKVYEWENKVIAIENLSDRAKIKLEGIEIDIANLNVEAFGKQQRVSLGSVGGRRVRVRVKAILNALRALNNT